MNFKNKEEALKWLEKEEIRNEKYAQEIKDNRIILIERIQKNINYHK